MGKSATTNECYPVCLPAPPCCPLLQIPVQSRGDHCILANTPIQDNLYYACLCGGNVAPNSTEVIQTIPYFTCSLNQADCVTGCGPDAQCANQCKETWKCAATAPTLANITGTTTSAAPATSKTSSSSSGTCNGFACEEGTDQKKGAGMSLQVPGLVAAGVAVGIAMMGL